jgi:hypothetical protein
MPEMKRHVGKITNTDKRCVVVYMQIPGKEDHALVVDTDALPDKFHEELMREVEHEGQRHATLADLLARRASMHSGTDILNTLHAAGYLQPVPIEQVEMIPLPGRKMPLSEVIKMTGSSKSQWDPSRNSQPMNEATDYEAQAQQLAEQSPPAPAQEAQNYNRILENQEVGKQEQMYGVAQNILAEAEMLEQEAQRKRNQAYEMAPSLKPKPAAQPKAQAPAQEASSSKSTTTKKSPGRPKGTGTKKAASK